MAEKELKIKVVTESKDIKTLQTELKQVRAEMDRLVADNKRGSSSYTTLQNTAKQYTTTIKELQREQRGLTAQTKMSTNQWLEFGENLTVVAAGIGIVLSKVQQFGQAIYDAYTAQEDALKRLEFAMGGQNREYRELVAQAENLQDITIYSDEEIEKGQAFLKLQGLTNTQIKELIETATDLSAITGDDLNSSIMKLAATYEGNIGRMGKLDDRLKDLSKTELENGDAVKILHDKYNGLAKQIGETTAGKVAILKNRLEELKESFGKGFIENLNKSIIATTKSTEELKKESNALKIGAEYLGKAVAWVAQNMTAYGIVMDGVTAIGHVMSIGTKEIINDLNSMADSISFLFEKANMMWKLKEKIESGKLLIGIGGVYPYQGEYGPPKPEKKSTGAPKTSRSEGIEKEKTALEKLIIEYDNLETKQGELLSLDFYNYLNKLNIILKAETEDSEEWYKILKKINEIKKSIKDIDEKAMSEGIKLLAKQVEETKKLLELQKEFTQTKGKTFREQQIKITEIELERQQKQAEGIREVYEYSLDLVQNMTDILGWGADNFISKMINGFQQIMSLANSLINFLSMFMNMGSGGIFGIIGSLFGGGKAGGGYVAAGTPYLVGERGTEMFIPQQSGNIISNSKLINLINQPSFNPNNVIQIYGDIPRDWFRNNLKNVKMEFMRGKC